MPRHLMSAEDLFITTEEWRTDLETRESVGMVLECFDHCMVAATFNTFEVPKAQKIFERKILPSAVVSLMMRSDVVDEVHVSEFLQHAIQFFLRTIERDNMELLEALRPVLVYRHPDDRLVRARSESGPYEFYQNHGIEYIDEELYPDQTQVSSSRYQLASDLYKGLRERRERGVTQAVTSVPTSPELCKPCQACQEGREEGEEEGEGEGQTRQGRQGTEDTGHNANPNQEPSSTSELAPEPEPEPEPDTGQPPPQQAVAKVSQLQLHDAGDVPKDSAGHLGHVASEGLGGTGNGDGNGNGNGDQIIGNSRRGGHAEQDAEEKFQKEGPLQDGSEGSEGRAAGMPPWGVRARDVCEARFCEGYGRTSDKSTRIAEEKIKLDPMYFLEVDKVESMADGPIQDVSSFYQNNMTTFMVEEGHRVFLYRLHMQPPAPSMFVKGMLDILFAVSEVVKDRFSSEIANVALQGLSAHVDHLTDDDLKKDLKKAHLCPGSGSKGALFGAINSTRSLITSVYMDKLASGRLEVDSSLRKIDASAMITVLKMRYNLCLKHLKGPTLQVRIMGLNELRHTVKEKLQLMHSAGVIENTASSTTASSNANMLHARETIHTTTNNTNSNSHDRVLHDIQGVQGTLKLKSKDKDKDKGNPLQSGNKTTNSMLQGDGDGDDGGDDGGMDVASSNEQLPTLNPKQRKLLIPDPKVMAQLAHSNIGKEMSEWLLRDGVVDLLFCPEYLHTETIKRSGEIPSFLAFVGRLSNTHLRTIFMAARQSAHESIRHAVFTLLQGLFPKLSLDQLLVVNDCVRSVPISEYDIRTLYLLRDIGCAYAKLRRGGQALSLASQANMDKTTNKMRRTRMDEPTVSVGGTGDGAGDGGPRVGAGGGDGGDGVQKAMFAEAGRVGESKSHPTPTPKGNCRNNCGKVLRAPTGVDLLWDCMLDNSHLPSELHEEALSCLHRVIVELGGEKDVKEEARLWLTAEAIGCLKSQSSHVQALRVLGLVLDSFHSCPALLPQALLSSVAAHSRKGNSREEDTSCNPDIGPNGEGDEEESGNSEDTPTALRASTITHSTVAHAHIQGQGQGQGEGQDSGGGQGLQCKGQSRNLFMIPVDLLKKSATPPPLPLYQETRGDRDSQDRDSGPVKDEVTFTEAVKSLGLMELVLEELMNYKDEACAAVNNMGLRKTEVDSAVLSGHQYPHLEAIRHRLSLMRQLVSITQPIMNPEQACGLWDALVERALSHQEADLSFEALLNLRRDTPQGWTIIARTFFHLMCEELRGTSPCSRTWSVGKASVDFSGNLSHAPAAEVGVPSPTTFPKHQEHQRHHRRFNLRQLRPAGFSLFMACMEAAQAHSLALALSVSQKMHHPVVDHVVGPDAGSVPLGPKTIKTNEELGRGRVLHCVDADTCIGCGSRDSGACCKGLLGEGFLTSGPCKPAVGSSGTDGTHGATLTLNGNREDVADVTGVCQGLGLGKGAAMVKKNTSPGGCRKKTLKTLNTQVMGLEALWIIALEVAMDQVAEAAMKKLCQICLHGDDSQLQVSGLGLGLGEANESDRVRPVSHFVSQCVTRLSQAAAVLQHHNKHNHTMTWAQGNRGEGVVVGDPQSSNVVQHKAAAVTATRCLGLLLAYLTEAGRRLCLQGATIES
ncbi:unnamed protein product, partial [Discosporangium mesarthrocarpum]